jgi:uncharacterized membrane protein YjjB (DUF3815 family)
MMDQKRKEEKMPLDSKQLAQDIAANVRAVTAAQNSSNVAVTASAAAAPGTGDFCSIWPKAKPVLELVAGVVIFIPGAGTTAGAVLQGLLKVGDQISADVCK